MSDTAELSGRLAKLDACAVSDALDKLGLPGVVSGLFPLTGPVRIAGPVATLELGSPSDHSPTEDNDITLSHPVEKVNWEMADKTMRRLGLALPTGA